MEILDVDLLAFERGDRAARQGVVDGGDEEPRDRVVYVEHDMSIDMIDEVYGTLEEFFSLPQDRKDAYKVAGSNVKRGTQTACGDRGHRDVPDFKEMLNWHAPRPKGHPLGPSIPSATGRQHCPTMTSPGSANYSLISTTRSWRCRFECRGSSPLVWTP